VDGFRNVRNRGGIVFLFSARSRLSLRHLLTVAD
jgi:hypothetical protein